MRPRARRFRQQFLGVLGTALLQLCLSGCASAPEPQPATELGSFSEHFSGGLVALEEGDHDGALVEFKKAIQRNPRHPYPHYYMGVLYADQGDTELAIVAFQRAIELENHFPEALYNLGTLLLQRRETTQAVQVLEQAVRHDPEFAPAFNNLAKAYFLAGYPQMAGAAYEEALAVDPDNRVALEGLAQLARGAGAEEAEKLYRSRLEASAPSEGGEGGL